MIINIENDKVDKIAFNWIFNRQENISTYPPIVWKFEDRYFQLNMFEKSSEDYFLIEGTLLDALNSSINFYNQETLNIIELSNIYTILLNFSFNPDDLKIFNNYSINGKKHFKILEEIQSIDERIKIYISEKNVSLKTIGIYLKLNDNLKSILIDFVLKTNPSVSNFRKFINILFDYSRIIKINQYDKEYFDNLIKESNKLKYDFEKEYFELVKSLNEIKINNFDNFETNTLSISFDINSFEDFNKKLKYLDENKDKIKNIYNLLKKYDLH